MASVFPNVKGEGKDAAVTSWRVRLRRDRAVKAIVRNWRVLTGGSDGERTLVACSGGVDSCALVVALGTLLTATDRFVVGHVVHDLREEREAMEGREVARGLAERMGMEFCEARVRVKGSGGNAEGAAREARYGALARMARERGIGFVAVGHQVDDQIETVVMSLLRGAAGGGVGVRGMVGKRMLDGGCGMLDVRGGEQEQEQEQDRKRRGAGARVWLVRPMLTEGAEVDRVACRRICEGAGVEWAEDLTNGDLTRLRAAVRGRVAPVLKELRPDVGRRVMAVAGMAEAAGKRLEAAARKVIRGAKYEVGTAKDEGQFVWARGELRGRDVLVLGAVVRGVRRKLCGRVGEDRVSKRAVDAVVRAIRDESTEVRRCVVGGMEVEVTARRVVMRKRAATGGHDG